MSTVSVKSVMTKEWSDAKHTLKKLDEHVTEALRELGGVRIIGISHDIYTTYDGRFREFVGSALITYEVA